MLTIFLLLQFSETEQKRAGQC